MGLEDIDLMMAGSSIQVNRKRRLGKIRIDPEVVLALLTSKIYVATDTGELSKVTFSGVPKAATIVRCCIGDDLNIEITLEHDDLPEHETGWAISSNPVVCKLTNLGDAGDIVAILDAAANDNHGS